MKNLFVCIILVIFLILPAKTYAGAWEQAQELCKSSGGNCNYNIPTPTPSIDKSYSTTPSNPKPSSYTKPKAPALSPSQSMTIGIFGSLLSGLFSGIGDFSSNDYDYEQAQKQKAYEEEQKKLMLQKQNALNKWHAIQSSTQSSSSNAQNPQTQNPPIAFKNFFNTPTSSLQPAWQTKVSAQDVKNVSLAQSESQFDFNHEIPIFIENRLNDIVQESPSSVELNENSKKTVIHAQVYYQENKLDKSIQQLNSVIESNPFNPNLHHDIALLYAQVQDYQKAISHMNIYLALLPNANDAQSVKDEMIKWEFKLKGD